MQPSRIGDIAILAKKKMVPEGRLELPQASAH